MSSRVVEFADSAYKGWMAQCLSCLVVQNKQPPSPHGPKGGLRLVVTTFESCADDPTGVEKEMKICHNQSLG